MYQYRTLETRKRDLTKENFEMDTRKKEPYYIKDNDDSQYAICPACDNPIQIIGLYKPLKNTDRAYARHSETLKQLIFTEENYKEHKDSIILERVLHFDFEEYEKYLKYPINERDKELLAIAQEIIKRV